VPETELLEPPFDIPASWPRCWAMDTDQGAGWTAVVWLALDRQTQTLHLYDCYKRQHVEPVIHAQASKTAAPGFLAWLTPPRC
jgi:hypothetical protein